MLPRLFCMGLELAASRSVEYVYFLRVFLTQNEKLFIFCILRELSIMRNLDQFHCKTTGRRIISLIVSNVH